MAFTRPTLGQLIKTGESEINALIPGADARLRYSVFNVFARVWAALTDGLYGALNFLSRQLFATTAEGEYLERIAESYGVARLAASPASGCLVVQGAAGTALARGLIFQRSDGVLFESTEAATIPGAGYVNLPVVAQVAGLLTNTAEDASVTLSATVSGVTSVKVCTGGLTGGADDETDDALRARLLFRLQNPPGAGTAADWERWAREYSPSVTRVWVIPQVNGNGTVGLVFTQDNGSVIPSASELQGMRDHLAQYTPMGATLYVYPPTLKAVDFTIKLTPSGDTLVQNAVRASLADLMLRESGPGESIGLSLVSEAISLAQGEIDHTLVSPTDTITFASSAPVFEVGGVGTITWA